MSNNKKNKRKQAPQPRQTPINPMYRGYVFDLAGGKCTRCEITLDFDIFVVEAGQPICLKCL